MTALTTSPFFTLPPGMASLTVATMTPPMPASRRPDPPFTRMQRISRAPVLSATRSRDSCWITGSPLPRGLDDLGEPPVLRLRKRTCLDDQDDVADLRLVLLVVGVELDAAPDDLLVARVRLDRVDLDDDRLVHRVGDDDAAALLPPAALGLRLRCARDRLALGRAFAHRLRVLVALRARQPLALLLLRLLGARGGGRPP